MRYRGDPPRENIPHRISGEIVQLSRRCPAALGHLNAWLWLLQGINNQKRSTSAPRVVVNARLASLCRCNGCTLAAQSCRLAMRAMQGVAARPSMMSAVADTYRAIRWLFVSSWDEHDASSLAFLSSHKAYTNYTEE